MWVRVGCVNKKCCKGAWGEDKVQNRTEGRTGEAGLYSGCGHRAQVPTLRLIGKLDDITAPQSTETQENKLRTRKQIIQINYN